MRSLYISRPSPEKRPSPGRMGLLARVGARRRGAVRTFGRSARLRASGMSFRSAVTFGLGLSHVRHQPRDRVRDNGVGLAGDRKAIAGDFESAAQMTRATTTDRG